GPVDGRTDIFATAVVLYELLTGRRPFEAESPTATLLRVVRTDPLALEVEAPNVPAAIVVAVAKGLRKEPDARYQSAAEFSAELQLLRMSLDVDMSSTTTVNLDVPPPTPEQVAALADPPSKTLGRRAAATARHPRVAEKIRSWFRRLTAVIMLGFVVMC